MNPRNVLRRVYRWMKQGPVVTQADGSRYVVTSRGPWVSDSKFNALIKRAGNGEHLGSRQWIVET